MVQPEKTEGTPSDRLTLSALHQRTIAVQLSVMGRDRLLFGRGVYERDRNLGNVLRVQFPSDADCEIVLAEDTWSGEILPGEAAGCDYLIRLG